MSHEKQTLDTSPAAVTALFVAHHREFLRYVERRTGDRALAEEIVQDAFVRGLERADQIDESVIGWFYRVLRNAVIDHQRRRAVVNRRLEELTVELSSHASAEPELARIACACVAQLAETLKPEYADVLRKVELEGVAVKDYAAAEGISASAAGVRVFRARAALRKQVARACSTCADHGCFDCSCGSGPNHRL